MLKVKVFTIGKCKEAWLLEALTEYEKRLKRSVLIEWHLAKDNSQLIEWTQNEGVIALDPKGELLDSVQWSEKMAKWGSRLTFCIGGSDGLPVEIVKKAIFKWSLSPLTFTHQMTRLILVEQVYRAIEIERGSQYHR